MQYRDRILPLVFLNKILETDGTATLGTMDSIPVVVFNDGDRSIGIVVDQIVDVTEESVSVRLQSRRKGLLGSAVVGKYVTDFLDIGAVIELSRDKWHPSGGAPTQNLTVLVAGSSAFSRGMIRSMIEMSQHTVVEASDEAEAARLLASDNIDALIAVIHEPLDLARARSLMERTSAMPSHPLFLVVAESNEDLHKSDFNQAGFPHCIAVSERTQMIQMLEDRLVSKTAELGDSRCAKEVA